MSLHPSILLTLLGPTASGKSDLALKLAPELSAEIICLDSTTLYKHFNIGSSKPDLRVRSQVPHHLVDLLEPLEPFSAFDFIQKTEAAISDITKRQKLPLLVGGSYFYLRSLQNGLLDIPPTEPEIVEQIEAEFENQENASQKMHEELRKADPPSADRIHPHDHYRLVRALSILRSTGKKPSSISLKGAQNHNEKRLWMKYAVLKSRHDLTQAITVRTDKMLQQGLVEETQRLIEQFPNAKALSSVGYFECVKYIKKEIDLKQLRSEIIEKTRQLAKRQMTWLRSDPEVRFIDERDEKRIVFEIKQMKEALK